MHVSSCFSVLKKKSLLGNVMMLFYIHRCIAICMKRKTIRFSCVTNCVFCLQIDLESFMLGFSARSDDLLKEKKTHGFTSCIVINICPLQILSMKKAWEYRGN